LSIYSIEQDTLKQYHYLIGAGHSQRQACESLGVARSTMQDLLKRQPKSVEDILNCYSPLLLYLYT